jgi:hypothetical protein
MSAILAPGRLCNQVICCLFASILSKKHNLKMNYIVNENIMIQINKLGIELYCGENVYENMIELTSLNFFELYNADNLQCNVYSNEHQYYQTLEFSIFVHNKLVEDDTKNKIISNNSFKERYNNNNDCFIHIRLTDVADYNPGVEYYIKALSFVEYDTLYIASDDIEHTVIKEISSKNKNVICLNYHEVDAIHFGSTCKYVILSHGSFSTVIGYLSFYSKVYYPSQKLQKTKWSGDIQNIPGWIEIGGDGL